MPMGRTAASWPLLIVWIQPLGTEVKATGEAADVGAPRLVSMCRYLEATNPATNASASCWRETSQWMLVQSMDLPGGRRWCLVVT